MGYLHGVSSPRYDELSPLDRAINAYSEKATRYFEQLNLSDAKNAPTDVKEQRKHELAKAQAHLANERRLMEAIADVQARLEQYREIGRGAVHAPNRDLTDVARRGEARRRTTSRRASSHRIAGRVHASGAKSEAKREPFSTSHHPWERKDKVRTSCQG